MSDPHPHQAGSDEADPEKMSTPIGVARDLEEMAEDIGATTTPNEPEVAEAAATVDDAPPTHGPR
jgi:hypothetical protein